MKLLLVASDSLRPAVESMTGGLSNQIDTIYLASRSFSDFALLERYINGADGYDAVILADGAGFIGEEGLEAGPVPLVLPRVHNAACLLLGGADAYRKLFFRFDGALGWGFPGVEHVVHYAAPEDCGCLCYLADTHACVRDTSLAIRTQAHENGWDFLEAECDFSLLTRLLSGDWQEDDIITVSPGKSVFLTYRSDILA